MLSSGRPSSQLERRPRIILLQSTRRGGRKVLEVKAAFTMEYGRYDLPRQKVRLTAPYGNPR